jgi:hypothetical protein
VAVSAPVVQDNHALRDTRIPGRENAMTVRDKVMTVRDKATVVRDKAAHTNAVPVRPTTILMQNTA